MSKKIDKAVKLSKLTGVSFTYLMQKDERELNARLRVAKKVGK